MESTKQGRKRAQKQGNKRLKTIKNKQKFSCISKDTGFTSP